MMLASTARLAARFKSTQKTTAAALQFNARTLSSAPAVGDTFIKWYRSTSLNDITLVGGKNASLGEMFQKLEPLGIKIPDGFAVTALAYKETLSQANAWDELRHIFNGLSQHSDSTAVAAAGLRARELVYAADLPKAVEEGLREAWRALKVNSGAGDDLSVAVRSSATAEDLPTASFAGQHDTYLNVTGEASLVDAVKRCQASLFTDRAIAYRINNGFDHLKVALSVGVQRMVRSDKGAAGVIFTLDTESGHPDMVFITGAWGLGENVVAGNVDPDEWYVHKPTFNKGFRSVIKKSLGAKQMKMVYSTGRTKEQTSNRPTPKSERLRFCLSNSEVLELADAAIKIEDHYSELAGVKRPMDIEWAKDGVTQELFIVQARPETVISQRNATVIEEYFLDDKKAPVLATGRAIGSKISQGLVRIIASASDLAKFNPNEVLVADSTTPDMNPIMKTASAIISNRGGRTCHAAIVARELGIPAVVGTGNGTDTLKDGELVTVSCSEGADGTVYRGAVPFHKLEHDLSGLKHPHTKIMVNLGNPEMAFQVSRMDSDGVGLARMEFIISEHIKVHPMAALHPERISSKKGREQVVAAMSGYPDGAAYFTEKLSEGVGTIAAAFYPRPVIVRLSDFKTNEYASLLGGADFEPHEENPMIGFRGAARYVHPAYAEGFALECAALKRVREYMGLTNLKIMVPFCRRLSEAKKVLGAMSANGLKRGESGLEVYVMCEIPNNVIMIDEFADLFDGFSIGSNDLTQLTLGVDRDSAIVADSFDEQDPGMLRMLELAVEGAKRNKRHVGICGQAPSDHIELARYLLKLGIDSISLTPDRVLKTMIEVQKMETEQAERLPKGIPVPPPSYPPPSHNKKVA